MVDGWMGDDWFHFGAFRQTNFDYFTYQTMTRGEGHEIVRQDYDDYTNFLRAGSAGAFAKAAGLEQLPFWRKVSEHPAYAIAIPPAIEIALASALACIRGVLIDERRSRCRAAVLGHIGQHNQE